MYDVNCVLQLMRHQAELDMKVEEAKKIIAYSLSVEDLFHEMDRGHKGYLTDIDLWTYVRNIGADIVLGSITTLISEIHLRLGPDHAFAPGRLSMRELAILIFPVKSREHELAFRAASDNDLLNKLNPGRLGAQPGAVSGPVRYKFRSFLDWATFVAEALAADRRQLRHLRCDETAALNDTFSFLACGRQSFSLEDVRRAFIDERVNASTQQLELLRRRYQPLSLGGGVHFSEFVRQLRPL